MVDRLGQQLGNYLLIRLLGEGGFAEVYLGEHIHLGTQAAIKVLHTQLTNDDVDRFRAEARTIARLLHPHIVRVLDFGVEGRTPFMVMDYAPNGSLRQRHPKGIQLPLDVIVTYVKQMADALQYAHDEKVIHRDIKPENMLIARNNEILLSDFGIALVAQSSRYQSVKEMAGTMAYMAPEQIQGKPRPASDQYSLGIVVYEWISGDRPFHGSLTELVGQHLSVPPPSLKEKVPDISPALEQVVLMALEKDPHRRFESITAFASALEQAYQGASLHHVTLPKEVPFPREVGTASLPTQLPQATNIGTPPSQSILPTIAAMPSYSPALSLHTTIEHTASHESEPSKARIPRRAVIVGLAGLAGVSVVGGSLSWLALSLRPQTSSPSLYNTSPARSPSYSPPIPRGTIISTYHGHSDLVTSVAWSPDSKRIASASSDKTVQVWNATNGKHILTYSGHSSAVVSVAWSSDGTSIASQGENVQIWDAVSGKPLLTYQYPPGSIYRMAWSPDGKRIAIGDANNTVQVFDVATGNSLQTYRTAFQFVRDVAWSPDGIYLASRASAQEIQPVNANVQVWNTSTEKLVFTRVDANSDGGDIAWSPKGGHIAAGNTDPSPQTIVRILDATTGNTALTYSGHTLGVNGLSWSPDGNYVASGSYDQTVQIWNATTASLVYRMDHHYFVYPVAWSPNGAFIASGGGTYVGKGEPVFVWTA
jgi:eukaryotic-like serine/threonine-protein kinase